MKTGKVLGTMVYGFMVAPVVVVGTAAAGVCETYKTFKKLTKKAFNNGVDLWKDSMWESKEEESN